MKKVTQSVLTFALALMLLLLAACTPTATPPASSPPVSTPPAKEPVTMLIAAAASLENAYVQKLIPMFEEKYDWITVQGTYDSSGKLQTQIEEGLPADVFMSAAMKQMNELAEATLVEKASVVKLLENKIVLIKPKGGQTAVTGFENVQDADIIAVGDPESVPAGQYAREAFTSLGNWDAIFAKASVGTNVTEVLNWVAAASAEVGVVYATDAASSDGVEVIAEAPVGSLASPVIYPVGLVAATQNRAEAELFIQFLSSPEAIAVFESYGFAPAS